MPVALSAQSRQCRLIPGGSKRCAEVHPGPSAGLPSDGRSPSRACLQLVLLVVSISDEYLSVLVQGTSCLAVAFGEGRSLQKRLIVVSHTERGDRTRIISARLMDRKERKI